MTEETSPTVPVESTDNKRPNFNRHSRTAILLFQWALIALLFIALLLQITLADRARLSTDARWRPSLHTLCQKIHCTLPPWHEPTAFTMFNREVQTSPEQSDILLIQASFRNDAKWAQPWPVLQLTLSDINGQQTGAGIFTADQYLGQKPEQNEILPGQSAEISLQLHEPENTAVTFNFEFH